MLLFIRFKTIKIYYKLISYDKSVMKSTFGEGGRRDVVLVPVAIAGSDGVELMSKEAGEGGAKQGAWLRLL